MYGQTEGHIFRNVFTFCREHITTQRVSYVCYLAMLLWSRVYSDDDRMINEYGALSGWELSRETEVLGEKLPQSTTNPTWPDVGLNPNRRGGELSANRLSYDTALRQNTFEVTSCHRRCLTLHFCSFIILNNIVNILQCTHNRCLRQKKIVLLVYHMPISIIFLR
jgi:hypothetical protein